MVLMFLIYQYAHIEKIAKNIDQLKEDVGHLTQNNKDNGMEIRIRRIRKAISSS